MKIICYKHREFQTISDILRLYYQKIQIAENENSIFIDDEISLNQPCTIISELSTTVSKEQMRNQNLQMKVKVQTFVKDKDLKIESTVIPNALRREMKRQMYFILSSLLKIQYPWGSLTGIRPTQIAWRSYLAHQHDFQRSKEDLEQYWFVSPQKAELALETAVAENKILEKANSDLPMLYIGIPFCRTRCAYCSFITKEATAQSDYMNLYVTALIEEIQEISAYMISRNKKFQALYIGGGTPTALKDDSFAKLITAVKAKIPLMENAEITVEAGRADSISSYKLAWIKRLGNVRICVNPQTMHDRTLKTIGRAHSVEDVYRAMEQVKEQGFTAVNMDLILGLPEENKVDFLYSLEQVLELQPESITVHTMALKRSAFIEQKYHAEYMALRFPDNELSEAFFEAVQRLKARQYFPYYLYRQKNVRGGLENIGFAKLGHACLYNVGMMSDRISVIGLGSGSATKIISGDLVERIYNPKDILNYCQRISALSQKKIAFMAERGI